MQCPLGTAEKAVSLQILAVVGTQSQRSPPRGGEALWPVDEVAQRGQAKAPCGKARRQRHASERNLKSYD